jgi:hypothetical protein
MTQLKQMRRQRLITRLFTLAVVSYGTLGAATAVLSLASL